MAEICSFAESERNRQAATTSASDWSVSCELGPDAQVNASEFDSCGVSAAICDVSSSPAGRALLLNFSEHWP